MNASDGLRNAFEFGDDDLAANQGGEITDWQRRRLREAQSKLMPMLIIPVPLAILAILFWKGTTLAALALIAVAVFFTCRTYMRWRRFAAESQMTRGIETIRGWVTRTERHGRYGSSYWMEINGSKFSVTRAQYDSVTDGSQYRVHFTPLSRTIVSVEPEVREADEWGSLADRLGTL